MITVRPILASVRTDRGLAFWLWLGTKLCLGLGQMLGAIYVLLLVIRDGFSNEALDAFLFVAALTTMSLLLFRVFGWKPTKRQS